MTPRRIRMAIGTAIALMLLAGAAFGQDLKFPAGKTYKIGFASREIVNDYNRGIIAGARALIEAAGGTMVVTDGQGDPTKHNDNITNLINSGVDGLIIELGDAQQLAPVVAKATAAGIPVVTTSVGAHVPGSLTEVGGDEALMGEMMTRALLQSINYQGDVYAFWVPGAPLLETRRRILQAMVKDYPQVTVHEVPTEHSPSKVFSQMQDILTAHPQKGSIAAVWGAYDQITSGAVQAIMQAGRSEIKVASIDGDKLGFQMLFQKDSPFVATVAQDVPHIGELAAQTIIQAINGNTDNIPTTTFTNAWLATRHNGIKAAEMRWGANVWQDIKMDPKEIESRYPQFQDVVVVHPVAP